MLNLTVLIADDEAIECRALRMQIQKAFPEIHVLEPVGNGIALLESARKSRPDIVIADIEMPGMNGLTALEQLHAEGIRPSIIIITAYSSEHYLKESLSLRVCAYLEKPLRRERMEKALGALIGEIAQEKHRDAEVAHMREIMYSMRDVIRSELMMSIESDETDPHQAAQFLNMLDCREKQFLVMTFTFAAREKDEASLRQSVSELRAFEALRSLVQQNGWIDGHVVNRRLSCLVPIPDAVEVKDAYQIRQWACCETDGILRQLDRSWKIRVGIGTATAKPELLQKSRQQSIQALYRQGSGATICHYEDQPSQLALENPFVGEEALLFEHILGSNPEQMRESIRRCFASIPEWANLRSLQSYVLDSLLSLRRRSNFTLFGDMPAEIAEKVRLCDCREALEDFMIYICADCMQKNQETDDNWQKDIISQAKHYIHSCYNSDISLESTAEAVGVSRFYLSRLFKSHLGMSFVAYLTEQRVRMAVTIMQSQPRRSIREVAERVGFHDPDYFGKVFKKLMGSTISDYRDQLK